jgi:hypothetical protein
MKALRRRFAARNIAPNKRCGARMGSGSALGSILTAVIGLLGVVVGAIVTKRAEKDKAIHEIKQRIYSEYLEALYSAKASADGIYFTLKPLELEVQDAVRMHECFTPTLGKKALVKVNLRKHNARAFEEALARVGTSYGDTAMTRYKMLEPALEEIQDILRADLYPPSFMQEGVKAMRRQAKAVFCRFPWNTAA